MPKQCEGCDEVPSYHNKKCVECGYKFAFSCRELEVERKLANLRTARAYTFVRLLGTGLSIGAVGATILDYPTVGAAVMGLGIAIFVAGLVGEWWNA